MIPPAALLLLLAMAAAQLKAPPVIPRDHGTVVTSTSKGEPRWSADWTMEPWTVAGKKAVRFTENGKGHYSPFPQEIHWTLESIWLADGSFFPLQFEKTIRDTQGQILAVEKKDFDGTAGKVRFERRDEKGKAEISTFPAAPDTLTIEGIAGILQFFPFSKSGGAGSLAGHLLSNEPKLYDVTIESRGTERVKTSIGDIDCYKIEMVPHLGLLNVVRAFYPKTYFWFRVAEPHAWVQYQGLENGPGTPEIIMEAR
jgi:hypothetical protein